MNESISYKGPTVQKPEVLPAPCYTLYKSSNDVLLVLRDRAIRCSKRAERLVVKARKLKKFDQAKAYHQRKRAYDVLVTWMNVELAKDKPN